MPVDPLAREPQGAEHGCATLAGREAHRCACAQAKKPCFGGTRQGAQCATGQLARLAAYRPAVPWPSARARRIYRLPVAHGASYRLHLAGVKAKVSASATFF